MILKQISIQSLGALDSFEYDFENDMNIVSSRYTDELSYAIQFVLNHRDSCLPECPVSGNTQIDAVVRLPEKEYRLSAKKEAGQNELCLHAYDENGDEKTPEFLYLTAHCAEHDLSEVFRADARKLFFKPIQYLYEDNFYAPEELSKQTDRLSDTGAFRSYLKSFIKDFEPEQIRDGKRYELCLKPNGKYVVRYKDDNDFPVFLSETEKTLLRYLCFLRTAEFWHGFEEIRNIHSIKKPILVENFLERLDLSVDVQKLLKRTMQLKRQVILLTV